MKSVMAEMLALLQSYIRIDTSHPSPDYATVVLLLKTQALQDGFLVRDIILPSGNPVLIITLPGSSPELPTLALNHHMDVVSANNSDEWLYPPFAGTVHEGIIYGRGVQDCKGLGIAQYAALRMLKQNGVMPVRTIHYIVVPDEERGGFHGTKQFVEHAIFNSLNIGYVLDEGVPSGNATTVCIKTNERTPLQIRIKSTGMQGHAAWARHPNCIHVLTHFLHTLIDRFAIGSEVDNHNIGNHMSVHVTSLTAGSDALNVIPSQVVATIDLRVPSSIDLDQAITLFDTIISVYETLTYEIVATSVERYRLHDDSSCYDALVHAIRLHHFEPCNVAFQATTDARFYAHRSIAALGCTPFSSTPNLHGTNESITCNDFMRGIEILHTFLHLFCIQSTIKEL